MPILHDDEFGKITIRRSHRASQVRLRVAPDGTLRASLPVYAPTFLVKRLLKTSRQELRELLAQAQPEVQYTDGMQVGKSHRLVIRTGDQLETKRQKQQIIVTLPPTKHLGDSDVTRSVRDAIIAALRIEAKAYLPKRLAFLAEKHHFSYAKVRFSHASGRWGSCSTQKTISLNIALMKLPFELIDYVLLHELTHTVHMNHSPEFWQMVAQTDPAFKEHRALLRKEVPSI